MKPAIDEYARQLAAPSSLVRSARPINEERVRRRGASHDRICDHGYRRIATPKSSPSARWRGGFLAPKPRAVGRAFSEGR
jgi:hypothetical protein